MVHMSVPSSADAGSSRPSGSLKTVPNEWMQMRGAAAIDIGTVGVGAGGGVVCTCIRTRGCRDLGECMRVYVSRAESPLLLYGLPAVFFLIQKNARAPKQSYVPFSTV